MSGLRVLRPGPLSLLQDAGRVGWQHLGVSPGGVQDGHAAAWANRLLGNAWGTPLLEIALGGMELRAEAEVWLALAGAEARIEVDGRVVPNWSRFALRAGQRLKIGFAASGQYLYLAAAGGFAAEPVLGSISTQVREELGGLDGAGAALVEGDLLACAGGAFARAASVPWPYRPDYRATPVLRVITGGDAVAFSEAALAAFFGQVWQLAPQSDRMGARLRGEPLVAPVRQWSLGVARLPGRGVVAALFALVCHLLGGGSVDGVACAPVLAQRQHGGHGGPDAAGLGLGTGLRGLCAGPGA